MRYFILPLLLFTILTVAGARMHPLWGDEAETALFGRNILSYGVPKGWDGVNIMGINNGVVLDKKLVNHTSPWGQYYLVAASFALFGQSTFTARLPFIVLSVISVIIFYYLARRLTGDRSIAVLSTWILCLSVPFILFSFQARYYALTSLAALVMCVSVLKLMKGERFGGVLFALSGIAFFYGNYVAFAAFFASLLFVSTIYMLFTNKSGVLPFLRRLIVPTLVIILFTLPWYLTQKPNDSRGAFVLPDILSMPVLFFLGFTEGYKNYIWNNAFPIPALLSLLLIIWKRKSLSVGFSGVLFPAAVAIIFLCIMGVFTIVAEVDTSFTHVRYTMPVFPFFIIAIASLFMALYRYNRLAGAVVLALYIGTTVWTFGPPRSLLYQYIAEIIQPYKTPDHEVASFLQKNAKDGDTAFVSLDRDHEPLIFELGKKIKFINRVSLVNTRIFPENRRIIPRYIYDFRGEPDWVILYGTRGNQGTFESFDYRELPKEINLKHYEQTVLPVYFSDLSRPEMDLRSFSEIIPQRDEMVYIYKKI